MLQRMLLTGMDMRVLIRGRLACGAQVVFLCLIVAGCGKVYDPVVQLESRPPAPILAEKATVPRVENRHLLWGDVHIHTSYSYDAYVMGSRALPDDAYAFARGQTIEHALGYPISLTRPLDFAAVTDHAEYLGIARELEINGGVGERLLRDLHLNSGALAYTWHYMKTLITKMKDREKRERELGIPEYEPISSNTWQAIIDSAEKNNDPGRFTTFIGYEWSSLPNGENLHRNIIYADSHVPGRLFSARDSVVPSDLWDVLDEQRTRGMDMIAIPHNGNSSNGKMYPKLNEDGTRIQKEIAAQRMRNEPLTEIYQVKGSSEIHPDLSPTDEFADFEIYDKRLTAEAGISEPRGSYLRDALRTGLEYAHQSAFNPYQLGVIGSSDSHNGSSASEEFRHHGKLPMLDGSPSVRLRTRLLGPKSISRGSPWSSQGLAAVWARENTREEIFSAMRSRETYATSGTRISVRFFAGWSFDENLLESPQWVDSAYESGVPMGSVLEPATAGEVPSLVIWATRDPLGANLDRIQVIKGWIDDTGASQEKVFNVAISDSEARLGSKGRVKPVGNTVNLQTASYSNDIGSSELAVVWRDPEWGPLSESFYYVRVLEIPTPRWSTYDAVALGLEAPEPGSIQERAVTSAIWYLPRNQQK